MTVIVVTRLRLRDPKFFDEFFAHAVAVVEQAQNSPGNLAADVLAEANNTYRVPLAADPRQRRPAGARVREQLAKGNEIPTRLRIPHRAGERVTQRAGS
jgi:hypothetical protein